MSSHCYECPEFLAGFGGWFAVKLPETSTAMADEEIRHIARKPLNSDMLQNSFGTFGRISEGKVIQSRDFVMCGCFRG